MASKQALVFGASEISGWAVARECHKYPSETTFDRVITIFNKELKFSEFLLSENDHEPLEINIPLFETALKLVTTACPKLGSFSHQTGAKTYGFQFFGQPGLPWSPPHKESETRLPEPYGSKLFYYPQFDHLAAVAQSQEWNFCDIRPYVIPCFTPRSNDMGFAQALGIFLSLYKDLEGEGSEVIFPGDQNMWEGLK